MLNKNGIICNDFKNRCKRFLSIAVNYIIGKADMLNDIKSGAFQLYQSQLLSLIIEIAIAIKAEIPEVKTNGNILKFVEAIGLSQKQPMHPALWWLQDVMNFKLEAMSNPEKGFRQSEVMIQVCEVFHIHEIIAADLALAA